MNRIRRRGRQRKMWEDNIKEGTWPVAGDVLDGVLFCAVFFDDMSWVRSGTNSVPKNFPTYFGQLK